MLDAAATIGTLDAVHRLVLDPKIDDERFFTARHRSRIADPRSLDVPCGKALLERSANVEINAAGFYR